MQPDTTADLVTLPIGPLAAPRVEVQVEAPGRLLAQALPMTLVLGAAAFLRVWDLGRLGLNTDEAVYAGQAAAIATDPDLQRFFPVFRAHPLLFQMLLSLFFRLGVDDLVGRLVVAAIGVATVGLGYLLIRLLYGWRAGLIGALILALMPYDVMVTRQVLLDGPAAFLTTLMLYLVTRYMMTRRAAWLYAAGAGCGLAFLAKETSLATIAGVYAFFALAPSARIHIRDLAISVLCLVLVIAPYPVTLALSGRTETGRAYFIWQLFRRPNHDLAFYPTTLPLAIGPLVLLVAVLGLWLLRRRSGWRELLLVTWIIMPLGFFELWPVKGFQYPLPVVPAIVALTSRALAVLFEGRDFAAWRWPVRRVWPGAAAVSLVAVSLFVPTWQQLQASASNTFLAGTGGVPGGREVGTWIDASVPEDAVLLAIGPSMANIIEFYGHRKAYGLSVSPNPLHRNPSYEAVTNPDLAIRNNELQYVVWDAYSAARTPFFEAGILRYVQKYNGRIAHVESVEVPTPDGKVSSVPVIVVYEVRP